MYHIAPQWTANNHQFVHCPGCEVVEKHCHEQGLALQCGCNICFLQIWVYWIWWVRSAQVQSMVIGTKHCTMDFEFLWGSSSPEYSPLLAFLSTFSKTECRGINSISRQSVSVEFQSPLQSSPKQALWLLILNQKFDPRHLHWDLRIFEVWHFLKRVFSYLIPHIQKHHISYLNPSDSSGMFLNSCSGATNGSLEALCIQCVWTLDETLPTSELPVPDPMAQTSRCWRTCHTKCKC